MADRVDTAVFNNMTDKSNRKSDNFDFDTFYEKGDSLYSAFEKNLPEIDPDYPDTPMFTEKGMDNPAYIEAKGLTFSKPHKAGDITPRDAYFQNQMRSLTKEMPAKDRATFAGIMSDYGNKPRYFSSGKTVSPHTMMKHYKSQTKDMDIFDESDYKENFSRMIKETSLTK